MARQLHECHSLRDLRLSPAELPPCLAVPLEKMDKA